MGRLSLQDALDIGQGTITDSIIDLAKSRLQRVADGALVVFPGGEVYHTVYVVDNRTRHWRKGLRLRTHCGITVRDPAHVKGKWFDPRDTRPCKNCK